MPNPYFQFKQFTIQQEHCAMKVTTDACLFGAWVAETTSKGQLPMDKRQRNSSEAAPEHHRKSLLDIGTGTGLLSLMVAQKNEGLIDAIEIDAAAATQARENIAASPLKDKITIICQDVLKWQPAKKYDIIFSNPPFYQNELKGAKAERNIAHHDEGLRLLDMLDFLKNHLSADGSFFLLLPSKREKALDQLFGDAGLFLQQKVQVQQTLKHQPFRLMIQGRLKKVEGLTEQVIVIKNEAGDYTPAFLSLLKDYYLYL